MKVVEVSDLRTATDSRNYYILRARGGFGQRTVSRVMWQQFQKDKDGNNTEKKFWERGSYEEALALLASGESIDAKKVTMNVESYELQGRMVSTFSTLVFADENPITVFHSQNHNPIDEHGQVIAKKPVAVVAPKTTPAPGAFSPETVEQAVEEEQES